MIRIKAKGQIIAVMRNGELIAFETREEYVAWIKTDESNRARYLEADATILLDHLSDADKYQELVDHLNELDSYDLQELGFDTKLIE